MTEDNQANPFRHMGQWYWRDENGQTHGPFDHQKTALFNLLSHAYPDFVKPERTIIGDHSATIIFLALIALGWVMWSLFQ